LAERRFPKGFRWGTATAAHQVEGHNENNDWWRFEQKPGRILNGDTSLLACDHYNRYREDFKMLAELHQNAHRISIEWSRIEPAPGEFDQRQVRHYRDVLAEMREQGLEPMVTLHHFSSPIWFADRGGWAAAGSPDAFLPFVRKVVQELGDLVELWCTVNEPNIYAYFGWVYGEFPPGGHGQVRTMLRVLANLRLAHERAYLEIKRGHPEARVGLAQNKWVLDPANPRHPGDRLVASVARWGMDCWPSGRGRFQRVVAATSDFIGVNHYSGSLCAFDLRERKQAFGRRFNPPGAEVTDFDWPILPRLMRRVLVELKEFGKPVYITESGIATRDDSVRRRFLVDVLGEVWNAIQEGVDVRGYYHWTSMDNFEWARGYSMRFGLIECDRATMERTFKPSAHLYARIARANALPPAGALAAGVLPE
jgi:beta-glucosidase